MVRPRIVRCFSAILAAVLLGCWLTCATETEAAHSDSELSCVTCCNNHRVVVPPSSAIARPLTALSEALLPAVACLQSQTVIRLLVPPPKFLS